MAYIIETHNALQPLKVIKHEVPERITIWDWVKRQNPQSGEFPVPTICLLNGKALMREQWNTQLNRRDVVNFVALPAGLETAIIIAIVVAVISIAISLVFMLNQPKVPGEQPASDPVFSTKGQSNAIRLGEPIEVCYGRNRIYPSYASRPYFEYRNNDQFQFSLFCLGQGYYDIAAIQIGDTDINNYQEVEYAVYEPGELVTLFPTAVYTASEAGGQTLFGPNEPEYSGDGWIGPFPANPSGTEAFKIQVDFIYPKGIFYQRKNGRIDDTTIKWAVQRRLIDDAGAPIGPWVDLTGAAEIILNAATTTPQRKSYIIDVVYGRYEVRARRTSNAALSTSYGDEIQWDGLRTYLREEQNFGDVTLLAVRIRATNNLNSQTQQQFNVVATRKLQIRESGGVWSNPQATRSIIWALVDVFRSTYGGRMFDDSFFDWDALEDLDILFEDRGDHFDWCFRDPITVWEAARAVALVGRSTPLLAGSLLTIKRDGPLSIPVAMFNPENIVADTFEREIKLWDPDEFDSVRVEYTDATTGYKQETVLCTLPSGTTDHPQDVRFPGIQDRTHAYREGLYLRAKQRYLRENVTFTTGLEGYIPTFGDLIAVVHDAPRWGKGGYIVNAERGALSAYQLWLSEPVTFEAGTDYVLMLRAADSTPMGPYDVFQTNDPQQVVINSSADIDFLLDGKTEPMLFIFGVAGNITKYLKVVSIEPGGDEAMKVTAVNDAQELHTFDELTPAPLDEHQYAPIPPDLPEVENLRITQLDAVLFLVQAQWSAAFGAKYYIIQTSTDGENWQNQVTTVRTSLEFQAAPGDLWIRVAAVNTGQGPWTELNVEVLHIVALTLAGAWEDLDWEVSWFSVLGADSYEIKVYDNSGSTPVLKRTESTTNLSYSYNYDKALVDSNLVREMLVTVEPVFGPDDVGVDPDTITPTELALENTIPEPPLHLGHEIDAVESTLVSYRLFWDTPFEEDLVRVKVWVSATMGFDPSVTSPLIDETASAPGADLVATEAFASIELDSAGEHVTMYWRVGLFDVWGNEISTNVSEEQTIPAFS